MTRQTKGLDAFEVIMICLVVAYAFFMIGVFVGLVTAGAEF